MQARKREKAHFSLYGGNKSNDAISNENVLFSIRSQMLYPVELRAQNHVLLGKTHANTAVSCCFTTPKFRSKIRCINSGNFRSLWAMRDRPLFVSRAWTKILPRTAAAAGAPYYIRFERPSKCEKRVRVVHRSLRTNIMAAAKARAKLIIEPILNGQWETAEELKSRSGYATIGQLLE